MHMNTSKSSIENNYHYYKNGMLTTEFAQKLNIPWYKARYIEIGEIKPTGELLRSICELLNCTEDNLYKTYHPPFFYRKKIANS